MNVFAYLENFLGSRIVEKLKESITLYNIPCIRVNTLKIRVKELTDRLESKGWQLKPVPWCNYAFFVEKHSEDKIGKAVEHTLGYFYTQDAGSLVPVIALDSKANEDILDLCAAPGSKTTQIAQLMKNKGAIVANDVSAKRLRALRFNLQKCGVANCVVTLYDGRKFHELGLKFDRILVDAPCTATGKLIGYEAKSVLASWRPWAARRLARLQRRLLESAIQCAKKGGTIVYSTCSIDPIENELVVDKLLQKHENVKIEKVKIKGLDCEPALTKFGDFEVSSELEKAIRFYPWQNNCEGFFVCKLRVC